MSATQDNRVAVPLPGGNVENGARAQLTAAINTAVHQLGQVAAMRALLKRHGAEKLSDVPPANHGALLAEVAKVISRGPVSLKFALPALSVAVRARLAAMRERAPNKIDAAEREVLAVLSSASSNARLDDLPPTLCAALIRDVEQLTLSPDVCATQPAFAFEGCPQALILARATTALINRIRKNVPAELLALPTWVACDRSPESRPHAVGYFKSAKAPLNPRTGGFARPNDPGTWTPFEGAAAFAVRDPRVATVGVNLLGSDFVGIDLDHVLDDRGSLHPVVRELLVAMPRTYTERSPSGRGLRLFYRGAKPAWLQRSKWPLPDGAGELETYDGAAGRYLTVTGDVVTLEGLA